MGLVDIGVLLLSALLVCGGAYIGKHRHLGRKSGTLMLLCEAAYFTYLILHL
jgi:hypothetical protein